LRNEQMGNATGIFNLMRNTGASLGIAAMTTSLARGAQAHQAELVRHLTPENPLYRHWLETAKAGLADRLGSVAAGPAALGMLYQTLVRQATLLAFLDNFRMVAALALCCLPLVFLFRRVRARAAAPVP